MTYDANSIKDVPAAKLARSFLSAYLEPAFGSLNKVEIDLLVFGCLIDAKVINPEGPVHDIARGLNITRTRARTLLENWQLRSLSASDMRDAIISALKKTRFSTTGGLMTFGVESPILKEEITAHLRSVGVFPDASFSRELVRLPIHAFVEFLDTFVDERTKKGLKATLVADKQLPDTSFKGLAVSVFGKLGKKIGDEAGGAIAKGAVDSLSSFISGVLKGDIEAVTKIIKSS